MRIDRTRFGERKIVLATKEPIKKYFLAYEGVKTEVKYFNGICENKDYLHLSSSIELIPLVRNHINLGLSHPQKVFEIVQICIDGLKNNSRNLSSLIRAIVDYCFDESDRVNTGEDTNNLYNSVLDIFEEQFNLTEKDNIDFDYEEINIISEKLNDFLNNKLIQVSKISEFILAQFETFDKNYDEVCLIVDRDKKSFSENQFDELKEQCNKNNFQLYVSNPCFEFWLLLHFNEAFNLDLKELEENKKYIVDDEYLNYSELKLREIIPEFRKNNICFEKI